MMPPDSNQNIQTSTGPAGNPQAPVPGLDELLAAFHGALPRAGFEGRVLAHLHAQSQTLENKSQLAGRNWRRLLPVWRPFALSVGSSSPSRSLRPWAPSWAPMAIGASLLCVLAGGLAVEREYSRAIPPSHATLASITLAGTAARLSANATSGETAGSFSTASARRQPAGAIPAGNRLGRATRGTNAHHKRAQLSSSTQDAPTR